MRGEGEAVGYGRICCCCQGILLQNKRKKTHKFYCTYVHSCSNFQKCSKSNDFAFLNLMKLLKFVIDVYLLDFKYI